MFAKHPSPPEWADFARDTLDATQAAGLRLHLRTCSRCRRTAHAFAALAELGRRDADCTPSVAALARVRAMFGTRSARKPWSTRIGDLMSDSWTQPTLAGVRGTVPLSDRYLAYRTGAWRVAVRIDRTMPGQLVFTGQVTYRADEQSWAGTPIALMAGRRRVAETPLDASGGFEFETPRIRSRLSLQIAIMSARIRLEIPLPDQNRSSPGPRASGSMRRRRQRGDS